MAVIVLPPFHWDVMNHVKTNILEAHREDLEATLEANDVPLMGVDGSGSGGTLDIHVGHWKNWPHYPVVEIVARTFTRPWYAHSYQRDNTVSLGILCVTKNIEREDRDRTLSVLGAAVTAVLDAREYKSYDMTVVGQTVHVYSVSIGDVSLGTLDQGATYALELPYTAQFIYQIPASLS